MTGRRILVVDDHPLLATALARELTGIGADVEVVDPTVGTDAVVAAVTKAEPTCAVVDLGLPLEGGGIALIGPLTEARVPVVVLTGETEPEILARAVQSGALAVLSKAEPLNEIVDAIGRAADGQPVRAWQQAELTAELRRLVADQEARRAPFAKLSRREREILAGLIDGHGPAALAERDYVSVATVRTQIKSLLRKLGVGSQLEAVALANRLGWAPDQVPATADNREQPRR